MTRLGRSLAHVCCSLVVACCLTAAGPGVGPGHATARMERVKGGPLRPVGAGSEGLVVPRHSGKTWFGPFGELDLCTTNGEPATLERVRWHVTRPPANGWPVAHVLIMHPRADGVGGVGMMNTSAAGVVRRYGGKIRSLRGFVVHWNCNPDAKVIRSLLTTMKARTRQGAHTTGAKIFYSSGGREYFVRDR
jgi:hypothetical protein